MSVVLRTLAIAAVVLGLGFLLAGAGGGEDEGRVDYKIELDNAFGLIEGADVKVAGVRAGKIAGMDLDRRDMRALIEVDIDREGFGDLREDATCETRPQSLIGEYFIDCKPGTGRPLPEGGTLPVDRTASTVPVDLINNIMRRPYRERMTIILSELGAGLAARGGELNETIRRASPALREVTRVLAILRSERRTIRDLYADASQVVGELAAQRENVTRFVREARDTAAVGAARSPQVRRQLRALPPFLRELQTTMPLLGEAARRQTGAVRTLRAQAPLLRRFLDTLGPFAEASRPAVRTLGEAAVEGRPAMQALIPRLRELRAVATDLPEVSTNAAITLEHLDDRSFAVEPDPRSPGGKGFTGFEALLRYVFAQSQSINIRDGNNHILKIAGFLDRDCGFFQDKTSAKAPAQQRCAALLGPGRPGIDEPDPTATPQARARRRAADRERASRNRDDVPAAQAPATREPAPAGAAPSAPAPRVPAVPGLPAVPERLPDVPGALQDMLPGLDFLLGD
jgi:virulence factor Mce-like protein